MKGGFRVSAGENMASKTVTVTEGGRKGMRKKLTILDCVRNHKKRGKALVINDGAVIKFEKEGRRRKRGGSRKK